MKILNDYPLAECKLLYKVLHSQLQKHPDLLDSDLLHDLQRHLQQQAKSDAIDVSDHGAWDAWLAER